MTHIPTIGVDFRTKVISCQEHKIKLQLWDTAGQERFRNLTEAYFKGSSGIAMVYSVTDRKSFENVQDWM